MKDEELRKMLNAARGTVHASGAETFDAESGEALVMLENMARPLAAEVLRLRELVRRMAAATEAHLRMHDLHCGDDYLPAERRATRMPLDALLAEAREAT